jgi:transposase InsO family protein
MPFGRSSVQAKREFIELAKKKSRNMSALCRRFGVSRTAGYALLRRAAEDEAGAVMERSRRPRHSPTKTAGELEGRVLAIRDETHWGARKIVDLLAKEEDIAMHRSTAHAILRRNGRISPDESIKHVAWHRFEHAEPNDLWQMDFLGPIQTQKEISHTLTVIDDHSRYNVCLKACPNQQTETVQEALMATFRRYGRPWRMTMDNGSPWGDDGSVALTRLTAWLIRQDVAVSHSRPYHPQTQGKDERLHRTIREELLQWISCRDRVELQAEFDRWRERYNIRRGHEALAMARPIERYRPSVRPFTDTLLPIAYGSNAITRQVDASGYISFRGIKVRVGRGCAGLPVAIRHTECDQFEVYFCHMRIAQIDLSNNDDPRIRRVMRTQRRPNALHSAIAAKQPEPRVSSPEGPQRSGGGRRP